MADEQIRFDDAAAYEDFMGKWSRLAGNAFLDWLGPAPGLRWLDVGCGNGAFTELLAGRCAARSVQGIDPSEEQVAFARRRLAHARNVQMRTGSAMALPFADGTFDAVASALVIPARRGAKTGPLRTVVHQDSKSAKRRCTVTSVVSTSTRPARSPRWRA